jgi:hypothetical protein
MAILLTCQSATAQTADPFVHPGVLLSKAQLDWMAEEVNSGVEPWATEFANAQTVVKNSSHIAWGSLSYKVQGPWPGGWNQCGSYSTPDDGCTYADADSTAAYIQALLWYITGNQAYANNAITYMDAYAQNMKGYKFGSTGAGACPDSSGAACENGPLQAAWDSTKWPRAAEIIYYGRPASTNGVGSGWTAAEFQAFQAMLTNAYLPLIENGSPDNGNWELAMIEGMMGIAVVTENQALLQKAQAMWIQRIPATFYNFDDDGSNPSANGDPWPVPFPRSNGTGTTWNGQEIFTAATSGVAQETCRDLNHGGYSTSAAIAAAETDYIQSNLTANLYTSTATYTPPAPWTGPSFEVDAENRLVEMLNVNAGLQLAQSTTAPADFCTGAKDAITLGDGTTYVIGYNEYHNRLHDPNMADASGTTGVQGTSNTYNWINNYGIKIAADTDAGAHLTVFEALTHYSNAPATQTVVTVTANNQTMTQGSSVPTLTYILSPSVTLAADPTCATTATSGSPVGTYPIACSGAVLSGDTFTYVAGTLTVTAAPVNVTVTANNQTMVAGSAVPALTYTLSPVVTPTTNPTCTTTATSGSPAGSYPITCSGAVLSGDTFSYVAGTLTVTPAPVNVTVTANNQTMVAGSAVPALTYTLSPVVTPTTNPACTTTATSSSPAGTYPITCSGAVLSGDTFTYVAGTMTVTPATVNVTVTANNQTMVAGSAVPALTYTLSPVVTPTTNPACTTTATSSSPAGTYPITCSGAVLSGDIFSYVAGVMTVSPNSTSPTFTLSASPSSVSLAQDASTTDTITVTSQGGFNSAVALTITGMPASFETPKFSPSSVTPAANGSITSSLSLEAKGGTTPGTYTLTVTGKSGSTTVNTTITLTITAK